jgi:hypothetical protein
MQIPESRQHRNLVPMQQIREGETMNKTFDYEYLKTKEEVIKYIRNCEGRHTQQAIYSTFHDALTQVCFGCKKIISLLKRHLFIREETLELWNVNLRRNKNETK